MKNVGVREFRDHASSYLSGEEPLAVRRHGRVLGFYLPVKRRSDAQELQEALRELGESLAELLFGNRAFRRGARRRARSKKARRPGTRAHGRLAACGW